MFFKNRKNLDMKKRSKSDAISTKKELFDILETWVKANAGKGLNIEIGDKGTSNTPWLFIKVEGKVYYMNRDTKHYGVQEFCSNKSNDWVVIANNRGKLNKVTNSKDKKAIEGLYLYLEV